MDEIRERYAFEIGNGGLTITCQRSERLVLTAGEALMLLDVLRSEEPRLRQMAAEASPFPFRIGE